MVGLLVSDQFIIQSHTGPYRVNFDEDGIAKLNDAPPRNTHIIADAHVAELYANELENVLSLPSVLRIDAVESNKSLECMPSYVDHLVRHRIRRDHTLLAIGGGIIQDITCFLAATLLRGVEWQFMPTTLLAQADSCIGSKSSINSGGTKNILGTFTPPRQITLTTRFLGTLDERDVRSGIGEMIKVHAIDGPETFDRMAADFDQLQENRELLLKRLRKALEVKRAYIEDDEFDRGPRNIFNYGHSFGHAIEAATEFAIPHGISVTIGMDMANAAAVHFDVSSDYHRQRMKPVLATNYRGFEKTEIPLEPFIEAISRDKKNTGGKQLTLILPDRDGRIAKGVYPNDDGFASFCAGYLASGRQ